MTATVALVYDRTGCFLAVAEDFRIVEVVPTLVELEVAVPRLRPTWW